jgi:hypothetical protein
LYTRFCEKDEAKSKMCLMTAGKERSAAAVNLLDSGKILKRCSRNSDEVGDKDADANLVVVTHFFSPKQFS